MDPRVMPSSVCRSSPLSKASKSTQGLLSDQDAAPVGPWIGGGRFPGRPRGSHLQARVRSGLDLDLRHQSATLVLVCPVGHVLLRDVAVLVEGDLLAEAVAGVAVDERLDVLAGASTVVESGEEDAHRVEALGGVGARCGAELLLEVGSEGAVLLDRGTGAHHDRALTGFADGVAEVATVEAVTTDERGVDARVADLLEQRRRLGDVATVEDGVRLCGLHLGDGGGE